MNGQILTPNSIFQKKKKKTRKEGSLIGGFVSDSATLR
jgi:hypothetical protein